MPFRRSWPPARGPSRTTRARREEREQAHGRQPGDRTGRRAESQADGEADHDGESRHGLNERGQHVAREHRRAGDGHGAETIDDAAGHVHRHHDGRALDGCGHGQEQDAGRHVIQVCVASHMTAGQCAPQAMTELTTEHVDEDQEEDDGHADEQERHRRVAQQTPDVAARHGGGIAESVGKGCHGRA